MIIKDDNDDSTDKYDGEMEFHASKDFLLVFHELIATATNRGIV